MAKQIVTYEMVLRMIRLHASGKSQVQIGEIVGLSQSRVSMHLRRFAELDPGQRLRYTVTENHNPRGAKGRFVSKKP